MVNKIIPVNSKYNYRLFERLTDVKKATRKLTVTTEKITFMHYFYIHNFIMINKIFPAQFKYNYRLFERLNDLKNSYT